MAGELPRGRQCHDVVWFVFEVHLMGTLSRNWTHCLRVCVLVVLVMACCPEPAAFWQLEGDQSAAGGQSQLPGSVQPSREVSQLAKCRYSRCNARRAVQLYYLYLISEYQYSLSNLAVQAHQQGSRLQPIPSNYEVVKAVCPLKLVDKAMHMTSRSARSFACHFTARALR